MGLKDAYISKLEAQLKEWSAAIDQLKAEAENAQAEARIEYHTQLEGLQAAQEAARARLEELRAAGEAAWVSLMGGVEAAWRDLKRAVEQAAGKIK